MCHYSVKTEVINMTIVVSCCLSYLSALEAFVCVGMCVYAHIDMKNLLILYYHQFGCKTK